MSDSEVDLPRAVYYDPVVGYLLINRNAGIDGRFIEARPIIQDEDGMVSFGVVGWSGDSDFIDVEDGDRVVGAFPAPPGIYRATIYDDGAETPSETTLVYPDPDAGIDNEVVDG